MPRPRHARRSPRVADFSTIPELIGHAKTVDGATHILVAGRQTRLYFPRGDGQYEEGAIWFQNGYWHAPAPADRVVVSRLPVGAEPISSHTQRAGRRTAGTTEARRVRGSRRREPTAPSVTGAEQLADEMAQQLHGSKPKTIPGGFRWSEHNEAAQFTTRSPEHGQKVVVVVSVFADGSVAVDFFSDEHLSEQYENIGHFTYGPGGLTSHQADVAHMVEDVQWVWETVDGYAESWQEDGGGEVDEARSTSATNNERAVLLAIANSEYQDAAKPEHLIGHSVWSKYIKDDSGVQAIGLRGKALGAVFASLQKKGLIETDSVSGVGPMGNQVWDTVALTAAGASLLPAGWPETTVTESTHAYNIEVVYPDERFARKHEDAIGRVIQQPLVSQGPLRDGYRVEYGPIDRDDYRRLEGLIYTKLGNAALVRLVQVMYGGGRSRSTAEATRATPRIRRHVPSGKRR